VQSARGCCHLIAPEYIAALPRRKRDLLSSLSGIPAVPAADMAGSKWPVAIVGGGPSGTAAAIVLRRKNVPVLLLERHAPPREKVCGDGLIADSHEALHTLGLLDEVRAAGFATRVGRLLSPARFETTISADFTVLERHFLDGLLLRAALDRGATLRSGRVERAEPQDDGTVSLSVAGVAGPIRAEHVIIASGATARPWWSPRRNVTSAVAARCYIRSKTGRPEMVVSFSQHTPNGYGWIFPLGDDMYNIGVIRFRTAREAPKALNTVFRTFVEEEPIAREVWQGSTPLTELKGAPLHCGLDVQAAMPHAKIMTVGECIATTFPFTGEGIGKALQSGILAGEQTADALESDSTRPLAAFPQRLETELRPSYHGYTLAEKWLSRPWVSNLIVSRIEKSPYLRAIACGLMTGSTNPAQLLSVSSLVKSLWR